MIITKADNTALRSRTYFARLVEYIPRGVQDVIVIVRTRVRTRHLAFTDRHLPIHIAHVAQPLPITEYLRTIIKNKLLFIWINLVIFTKYKGR